MPPEFLPTHHRSLRLQNFTAFGDATFEFVPGVNVLVGENGTGKTHALKALYGLSEYSAKQGEPVRRADGQIERVSDLFGSWQMSLSRDSDRPVVIQTLTTELTLVGISEAYFSRPNDHLISVYLPPTDMIGHSKGFLGAERIVRLDFDRTYFDIVAKLEAESPSLNHELATDEMQKLQDRMGGTVEYDAGDRRFYLATPQGRIAMPLVAEGLRKFATLHTVWKNGWLRPGTCLFWDEPEANLNPKLMDEAVAAILALARGGVQVFLATHSYVILKELELQAGPDDVVRFFALEKTDDGTVVHPAERLADLSPNPILEQYERLYDLDLERSIRGARR